MMSFLIILMFNFMGGLVYGAEEAALKTPVATPFEAAFGKSVSKTPQSSDKDKPVSESPQSSDKDKSVSESSQLSDKDKPVSESPQPSDKDKPISESSKSKVGKKLVTQKIKQVFVDFIEILETEALNSEEYKKAVKFLEDSLYNSASFETLKLLATVYKDKDDTRNHIKVLNVLSRNHPKNAEGFYLLGMVYKELYFKEKKKHTRNNKEKEKKKEKISRYKTKSVDYFNQSLKIDSKYVLSYKGLLELLMEKNPKTDELIYTQETLSIVMDMFRALRKNKYYILLCQAYYDNNSLKQSRKACARSVQTNPNNPRSHLLLVLSQPESKEKRKNVLQVTEKFKQSFFVQYRAAHFFMNEDPRVAITHFERAYALQPEHVKLNEIMSQFLFYNNEEEKSYKHFLNMCLLTKGKNLKYFRIVKMKLYRMKKQELIEIFQEGIDKCYQTIKEELQKGNKI